MATMVAEPYVNNMPTMTGGVGHNQLKRFYKYHFIDGNPPDTELAPISRTVGADQFVDEMLFKFTHTSEIDWMLPGVKPTGRRVEFPSSQSCDLWTARSRTSTFTGTKPQSWCRLGYSILRVCRWPASRRRAKPSTKRSRAMNS